MQEFSGRCGFAGRRLLTPASSRSAGRSLHRPLLPRRNVECLNHRCEPRSRNAPTPRIVRTRRARTSSRSSRLPAADANGWPNEGRLRDCELMRVPAGLLRGTLPLSSTVQAKTPPAPGRSTCGRADAREKVKSPPPLRVPAGRPKQRMTQRVYRCAASRPRPSLSIRPASTFAFCNVQWHEVSGGDTLVPME